MEIKNVEYYGKADDNQYASVEITPTHEGGIFASTPFDGIRAVGKSATIHGITDKDHLKEIEAGNKNILAQYVQKDAEVPGSFKLVGCHASITTSEYSSHSAGENIQEFAPAITEA